GIRGAPSADQAARRFARAPVRRRLDALAAAFLLVLRGALAVRRGFGLVDDRARRPPSGVSARPAVRRRLVPARELAFELRFARLPVGSMRRDLALVRSVASEFGSPSARLLARPVVPRGITRSFRRTRRW